MTSTFDSYDPEKEIQKSNIYSSNSDDTDNDERHHIFKCMELQFLDKISIFVAEFIGTALILLIGCMGGIVWVHTPDTHVHALVFGLTFGTVIQCIACISGGHLNPAVTVAAVAYRTVSVGMSFVYILAQLLGAIVGYGLLVLLTPDSIINAGRNDGFCKTRPQQDVTLGQAFFIEFFATMVLIFVCCAVWDPRNAKHHDSVSIKFGLVITVLAIAFGPYTGCSMNPARTLGPAVFTNDYTAHWIYWVAPLSSAAITSLVYKALLWRDVPKDERKRN